MEFLRKLLFYVLCSTFYVLTAFAQTLEPTAATNGAGTQPSTPYASYSNGANVNIQNGNMSLATQDIFIPHPLGFGISRSTNAGIGLMNLEDFVEVFPNAVIHMGMDTRLDGRNVQVPGNIDRIVYENAEVDLGTLGKLQSEMTWLDPGQRRPHNEVSLRVGAKGWNVAWSDAIGVIVLLKTAPNATERPAIVLLINKDGGAEPFDFSTGESLWDKTGSKFTTPFGSTKEEVDNLQNLLLQNPDGIQHRFRKVHEGELFYQVYYSFPCDRWSHFSAGFSLGIPLFSFTRKTCHADFRLAGWKVYGFKLNRVEDDQGRFIEIDYMDPQAGASQNIIDETGRRITRRIDGNNLEEWQTGDRVWRMQFDVERRLQSATDPEGNTTIYKYTPEESPKRSLGWNSLSQPDKFLQIDYPTGGIIRYEWFGQEISVGEESAGHNTFVVVTEFPNPADRGIFNQKYHWVNEVTQSNRAEGNPAILSTLYDLDGSVKEHLFTKIQDQWRVAEEKTTANSVSISKRTVWHLNGDGKTIDGPKRIEVTREGVTYNEAEMTYDDLGRTVSMTDPAGGRTEYRYVADGGDTKDLVSQIRKVGENGSETIHHVYGGQDACGRTLNERQLNYTFRNINGDEQTVNKYCYDSNGNVIRELDGESFKLQPPLQIAFNTSATPAVGTEQMVFDRNTGWLLQETDQYGVVKRYTYNKTGNPIRIDFGNGSYIAYVYDVPGRTITTTTHDATTGRNVMVTKKFDGLGNLVEGNEGGAITRYSYTPTKKLQQMIYPDGRAVQYRYDALGRILEQSLSGHQPIRYSYSMRLQEDIPVQITQTNISGEPVVKVEHDLSGNLVTLEKYDRNGAAITAHYNYDALGNLLNIQTPEGLSISDSINYSTGEINRNFPGGDAHQFNLYESTNNGRIVHADASGRETSANMRYSANGLLQEIAFSGQNVRLNYGAQGAAKNRLISIQDNAGATRFAYNAGGAPEKIDRTIDALGQTYSFYQVKDSFGNLVRLIYPNGLIVYYKYDQQNRVVEVRKDSEGGLVLAKFEYEGGNDQPARITYANGVVNDYAYDIAGRLIRIDVKKEDGTYIQQERFEYDHRGRKTGVRHLDGSRIRYEYDGLSRIVAARYFKKGETTPSQFQEYAYDKDGNRVRYRDPLKEIQYTYENGKLVGYAIKKENDSIYEGSLDYALGDIALQKETKLGKDVLEKRFTFDPQHRLTSVEVEDRQTKFKTSSQYQYDYTGRRESVTVDGRTKYFLYGESIDPLMELNSNGEVEAFHVFVNGMRLAKVEGDELDFYHTNEMGDVLKMSGADGEEIQSVRYDPFGNINFLAGSEHNEFLFAGKPYDQATGLYYYGARYYDPILGRFLSRDPLLQGTNHYVYADNNPVGNKDVYGLWGFHLDIGLNFDFKKGIVGGAGITFTAGRFSLGIDASTLMTGGSDQLFKNVATSLIGSVDLGPVTLGGSLGLNNLAQNGIKNLQGAVSTTLMNAVKIPGPLGKFIKPFQLAGGLTFGGDQKRPGLKFADVGGGQNFLKAQSLFEIGDVTKLFENPAGLFKSIVHDGGGIIAQLANLKNTIKGTNGFFVLALGQRLLTRSFGITDFTGGLASKDPFLGEPVDGNNAQADTEQENFEGAVVDQKQLKEGKQQDSADKGLPGVGREGGNIPDPVTGKPLSPQPTDPILLHSGDLLQKETDLRIPGRGFDYEFTRVYRSRITYEGPLGFNWDHNYNKRLINRDDGNVARFDGEARFDIYEKQTDGSYKSPSGYFDRLTKNSDGTFTSRDKHGTVYNYATDGWIVEIKDRNNNSMSFGYEGEGDAKRLTQVIDTIGRAITYSYSADKLAAITDFSGRTIQFGYDAYSDLISVANPAGHTVRYTYSNGYLDDRKELNHNLLTVTDAKGQTYLKNTYSIYDRVTRQTFGDEGTFLMEYNQVASSLECTGALIDKVHYRTRVTDRIGNKIDYTFNCQGNPLEVIRYTRGVRSDDPSRYVTQYRYNEAGLLTRMTKPKGNVTEYEYDANGNLLTLHQEPGSSLTSYTYDLNFSQPISVTNAAGQVTNFTIDNRGNTTNKCLAPTVCESYAYNEHGQLIALSDGERNIDQYVYNESGYLSDIIRGTLLTNRFTYDSVGNITSFIDGRGNVFQFEVNNLNQVTRELSPAPLNYERRIDYDENNNVIRISGNATVETRFTYNILDRVTTKTIDGARTALTEYRYDLNENLARIIEPEGNSTFLEYDERDLPYRMIQGYRSEIETPKYFTYDLNGNAQTMRDGNGNITQYQYDDFDRVLKIIDPLANEMEVGYDAVSNITSITRRGPPLEDNPQLAHTEFIYDALNRLIERRSQNIEHRTQNIEQYLYDRSHRLTQLTDPNNNVTRFIYDGADRLTQKTDALGNQALYTYDGNNNVTEARSVEGEEWFADFFTYDSLNRLIERQDKLVHKFTYAYDSRGNLISTTDPKDTPGLDVGNTQGEGNKVQYNYDGLNRLIEEIKELTNTGAGNGTVTDTIATRYAYDDNSRLTEITDANNHITRFAYDALNRQVEVRLHNGNTYAKRYDRNGNLIEEIQPNGFKVESAYDALNRLITKNITLRSSNAGRESFAYDGLSRMVQAQNFDPFENPIGNVGYEYDSLSRVVAEIQNGRRLSKTYDAVGNVTDRTYPSGRVVANSYDVLNRLTAITQTPTPEGILENIFGADPINLLNAQYIGKDRPKHFDLGNGTKVDFNYDTLKRLEGLNNLLPDDQVIAGYVYGYDKAGNRLYERQVHDQRRGNVFQYDSLYRLVSSKNAVPDPLAEIQNPNSQSFSVAQNWRLDPVDNWLEKIRDLTPDISDDEQVQRFNPNEVNAYASVDGQSYVYDENGNLLDDGTNLYQYNYRNLLTRVVDKATGEEVATYGYDALGRRIFKTVDGQMTRYVFEGIHIVAEVAPDNSISKEFIYGNSIDDPLAVIARGDSDEAIYYYHKDGLGSTTALTDSEGNIAETYTYGPYGEPEIHDASGALLEESAAGNPFLYTGQMYDAETGFYYYKARYYHPTLGRFLQRDPLGYVDGYNLYAYTANNPINWIDPLGLEKLKQEAEAIQQLVQGFYQTGGIASLGDMADLLLSALPVEKAAGLLTKIPGVKAAGRYIAESFDQVAGKVNSYLARVGEKFNLSAVGRIIGNEAGGIGGVATKGGVLRAEGTVLSGHGGYEAVNGFTTIPQGTRFTIWTRPGNAISDAFGGAIESGQNLMPFADEAIGARSFLPGARVPNLTLYPPTGLNILGNPVTVSTPTTLNSLLSPNAGTVHWAACLSGCPNL